ncbi:nucleotidyltransferase family protein [Phycicoccus duodecadis]|uniref:Putative nucleotidyltransferase-like protein n=1 Tax=Phycicoccus duodecadis TaxID=173053 RepID=A0A2N3YJP6_9MICO|nr:nucleotidyltransferase family protein [Phycicoccus duodecadis]PKW27091.1 putative nucleotidyltransferase-like protein [Phycicoccus duodecadis]
MTEALAVPLAVRVELAHAAVQRLAEGAGVDLLHIKGPAVAPGLRGHTGASADADVLVRPDGVDRLMAALVAHGWRLETGFASGSAFDHAANLYHPGWGLLDVHRLYPGMGRDPAAAFAALWAERGTTALAHVPCPVPSPVGQSLVLLLHAARTRVGGEHPDIAPNWTARSEEHRRAVRALAERTGSTVALAAATGALDEHRGTPEAALWEVFAHDDDRLGEWRARWRSARGPAAKASVAVRSVGVNRYYLRQRLGHEPSRAEVGAAFVRRLRVGARALAARARRSRTGGAA